MEKSIQLEEKKTNILGQVIFKYLPYWPLFLLLLVAAIGGAWFYLRFTTPFYEASARVMIKDEKKGSEDAKALEALNLLTPKKIVENETEVIQSVTLLNKVVKQLHLYAPVTEEHKYYNRPAYLTAPVALEARDPAAIRPVKKVYFSFNSDRSIVAFGGRQYPLDRWVTTPYGELRFTRNKRYQPAEKPMPLFFSLEPSKSVAGGIQQRLKVTNPSKSSILQLALRDEVPERGEQILNQLIATYSNANIEDKNTLGSSTLAFVEDRIKKVERGLDSIERQIQQYRAHSGAIDIGMQGKLFLENVSTNDQKLSEINMQLAVLNQVEHYVLSKSMSSGVVPSTLGVTDPVLSQLVNKLYNSELEYESLRKTTGENSPTLVAITDQINKIKPSILENVQNQRRGLIASRNNIAATNSSYSAMLQRIPETERKLIDINREQSIKNEIYTFLLQKREEAALSQAATMSDSRVVDAASASYSPVSPKPKVVYLSAFLLAMFSGISLVALKETFSRSIMFRHEIEQMTDMPIIGEISAENTREQIVIGDDKKTFIAEQFRKLRMSLKHIGVNSKRKRILVTSAISGEGKSFVALNLALSLALTGKKVVLLDFDLNNPSLSDKLDIHAEKGITDYMLGECEPEDVILPTGLHENLLFMPTGLLPINPSELLLNGRAEDLLNQLDALYDYVVVDTAPVGPVTDAYSLAPHCDATLFVVRHKYTPKIFVERFDEETKINKLGNVAIVFNGVKPRGFGKKAYGYGYGYGYIYQNENGRKGMRI